MAADSVSLGRVHLKQIPPVSDGVSQIELTFDMDANGVLIVSARHKAENARRDMPVDARNRADAMIYPIEKAVRDTGVQVGASARRRIHPRVREIAATKRSPPTSL
jgi:molecular chaperone DnaK